MKKILLLLSALVLSVQVHASPVDSKVIQHLEDISVTVITARGQGSGVIKTRDGVHYVWTAGHVVASHRHERAVVDAATQSTKTVVTFDDVMVAQDIIENGRRVGRLLLDAEIIRFSAPETGEDLAVLRLYKKNVTLNSVVFYLDSNIPAIGTEMVHVGSMGGLFGANSYTVGAVSSVGRILYGRIFDQTCCTAMPGSSGGGMFNTEGKYIGMLVRGVSPTFNLMVPVRSMAKWAKANNCYWAMDDTVVVDNSPHAVENFLEAPEVEPPAPIIIINPKAGKAEDKVPDSEKE